MVNNNKCKTNCRPTNVPNMPFIYTSSDKAVIFSNTLPHRSVKVYNNSDNVLSKFFITFFIVNPLYPIEDTSNLLTPLSLYQYLTIIRYAIGSYISNNDIVNIILNYMVSKDDLWLNRAESLAFKSKAVEEMDQKMSSEGSWF